MNLSNVKILYKVLIVVIALGLAALCGAGYAGLAMKNIDDTYAETAKIIATRTTAEWLGLFEKTNVPINRVSTLEEGATDPHLEATGFRQFTEHPTEGPCARPGSR